MSEIRVKEGESLESALRRFKRSTARGFYKVMHILGVDVVYDHADYRLMSRRALDALSEYYEKPSVRRKKKSEAARKRKFK